MSLIRRRGFGVGWTRRCAVLTWCAAHGARGVDTVSTGASRVQRVDGGALTSPINTPVVGTTARFSWTHPRHAWTGPNPVWPEAAEITPSEAAGEGTVIPARFVVGGEVRACARPGVDVDADRVSARSARDAVAARIAGTAGRAAAARTDLVLVHGAVGTAGITAGHIALLIGRR